MKVQRALDSRDLSGLDRALKELRDRERYQLRILAIWSVLSIAGATVAWLNIVSIRDRWFAVGTGLVFVLIGVWSWLETSSGTRKRRRGIEHVKAQNSVTSIHVRSSEYFQLSETEDEGFHYLFQLPDNKVLSFGGQEFYPNKTFPSDDFEIATAKDAQGQYVLLETYVNGRKLQPIKKFKGKQKQQIMDNSNYPDPEEFTIVNGKLDDFAANTD